MWNEHDIVCQEGYYEVREKENEKIRELLRPSIEADRVCIKFIKENLSKLYRELNKKS